MIASMSRLVLAGQFTWRDGCVHFIEVVVAFVLIFFATRKQLFPLLDPNIRLLVNSRPGSKRKCSCECHETGEEDEAPASESKQVIPAATVKHHSPGGEDSAVPDSAVVAPDLAGNKDAPRPAKVVHDASSSDVVDVVQTRSAIDGHEAKEGLRRRSRFHIGRQSLGSGVEYAISEPDDSEENSPLAVALEEARETIGQLQSELDEEREASAAAAKASLSMIEKLQREKFELQLRCSEQQRKLEGDGGSTSAIESLNSLVMEQEAMMLKMEEQLERYKHVLKLVSSDVNSAELDAMREQGLLEGLSPPWSDGTYVKEEKVETSLEGAGEKAETIDVSGPPSSSIVETHSPRSDG